MPVEDFLAGKYLERADVVLTRREWDVSSWAIRWATNSPFSHAAMVFTGPQFEVGYTSTFVIESGTSGVDLTNLRDYIADKSAFIAIKRFKQAWFDEPKQAACAGCCSTRSRQAITTGPSARSRAICGSASSAASAATARPCAASASAIGTRRPSSSARASCRSVSSRRRSNTSRRAHYRRRRSTRSCSSGRRRHVCREREDWGYLDAESSKTTAVLFRKQNFDALQSVTPENLAASDKLEWLYFIKNGMVYKVDTYDDVRKLIE